MRLVYLGTPALAVPPLRALVDAGHDVVLAVSGPDRRRGRGPARSASPVKAEAERLGIRVATKLEQVLEADAALGVVVAYGHLVPAAVLARLPMLNLHFSLLPRWRGAAPVQRAILAGDEVTGVSIMALVPELDAGPLYVSAPVVIEPGEHVRPLQDRLVEVGTRLLVDVLGGPLPVPRPQEGEVTYAEKLAPAELELDWRRPAVELERVVRLDGAWTTWRGRRLRVLDAEVVPTPAGAAAPGQLAADVVATGDGGLRLRVVQPEGKRPMRAVTWLRGARPGSGQGF
jgi:methionyl-tRNA formyltransferase